jgi:GTP cyclohydrolase I
MPSPTPKAARSAIPSGASKAAIDVAAARRAIADLIRALGLDPALEPELAETPERVTDLYREMLSGLDPENDPDLATFPHEGQGDIVIVRDLPFHSLCMHHFVPFFGRALVAYLPGETLVGISGAARLLEHYARRPQLQERLGQQIADHLQRLIRPRGVAVVLEARHLCMEMRGIRKRGVVETRTVRGELADPRWAETLRLQPER